MKLLTLTFVLLVALLASSIQTVPRVVPNVLPVTTVLVARLLLSPALLVLTPPSSALPPLVTVRTVLKVPSPQTMVLLLALLALPSNALLLVLLLALLVPPANMVISTLAMLAPLATGSIPLSVNANLALPDSLVLPRTATAK